jgi:hypothetical protein
VTVSGLDGVLDVRFVRALERGRFLPLLREAGVTHLLVETCLYDRPGWRTTDLTVLAEHDAPVALSPDVRAVPLAAWDYANWTPGRVWPWRLWRLEVADVAGAEGAGKAE